MSKKSNVIVGLVAVGIIGAGVVGLGMLRGSGAGKDSVQVAAVQEVEREKPVEEVRGGEGASADGPFVASKQGTKYFPVDCGTSKTVKEENKIYFGSESEAVAAGYERSKTCK